MTDAYQNLKERFAKIRQIGGAAAILGNDAETSMQPGSAQDRTGQMMALAEVQHMLLTAPEVEGWLNAAEKEQLPADDARNLSLMRRQWTNAVCLPQKLVAEAARVESEGQRLHTEYGKAGDWNKMRDWYEHSFNVARQVGEIKREKLGHASTYDALLDSFSPDFTDAKVSAIFADIEKELPAMIAAAQAKQAQLPPPIPLSGTFPREQQEELCRRLAAAIGFDFNRGSLFAIKGHPSMTGTADDTRITTGVDEDDFLDAVGSTIHETGHGLYEQNTPAAWRYQPAGQSMGMAIHESQSRIMEVQACHTPEFFQFLEREARDVFNRPDDPALDAKNLERLTNKVQAGFIRIMSDEMTYAAHIILRHRLERDILHGKLKIDDLPKAWNEGMQKLLGITPPDHKSGCLQDVHWPAMLTGYFPAYTLGDMGAAQFFNAACRARPELRGELAKGNFAPLREWLRDNVHAKGSLLTTDELYKKATGETLNAKSYLANLRARYL